MYVRPNTDAHTQSGSIDGGVQSVSFQQAAEAQLNASFKMLFKSAVEIDNNCKLSARG